MPFNQYFELQVCYMNFKFFSAFGVSRNHFLREDTVAQKFAIQTKKSRYQVYLRLLIKLVVDFFLTGLVLTVGLKIVNLKDFSL